MQYLPWPLVLLQLPQMALGKAGVQMLQRLVEENIESLPAEKLPIPILRKDLIVGPQ